MEGHALQRQEETLQALAIINICCTRWERICCLRVPLAPSVPLLNLVICIVGPFHSSTSQDVGYTLQGTIAW